MYPMIEFKGKLPTKYGFLGVKEERVEVLLLVAFSLSPVCTTPDSGLFGISLFELREVAVCIFLIFMDPTEVEAETAPKPKKPEIPNGVVTRVSIICFHDHKRLPDSQTRRGHELEEVPSPTGRSEGYEYFHVVIHSITHEDM